MWSTGAEWVRSSDEAFVMRVERRDLCCLVLLGGSTAKSGGIHLSDTKPYKISKPMVKQVEIPKSLGGTRKLGIPTVSDRVVEMVVKMHLEPKLEPIFHDSSFGYRPGKSAIQAVGQARENCFRYLWVLEFDIKGLFENTDQELLMKAVKHHTADK